ncbi:MAG: sigma-54-dependent Fis family transcriptional regulator [Desulfobacterales bacterium]|nr:sigma-54-dependent Fis family transcriptional regulator [Desulfobacterales bacterium]
MESIKILVVEDSASKRDYLTELVRTIGYQAHAVKEKTQFIADLRRHAPDILLLGSSNHLWQRRAFAEVVEREKRGIPILIVQGDTNGSKGEEVRVAADTSSLPTDFSPADLKQAIDSLVQESEHSDWKELDNTIVGLSPAIVQIKRHIIRLSKSDVTILITGESGTGKELVARAIHKLSPRADKQFIKVNSAALPSNLLESELFGFEKGAFTGAFQKKLGKFELAHSGTIFLDEISEIPISMQAKLLQVLQDSEFSSLGSVTNTRTDTRVLAATNANLGEMVSRGGFRQDLYYRLNVVCICIPPLRERKEDIALLCTYFLKKYAARYGREYTPIKKRIKQQLYQYAWPGNVRELENSIHSITVLGDEEGFYEKMKSHGHPGVFPNGFGALPALQPGSGAAFGIAAGRSLKDARRKAAREAESEAIVDALVYTHWNRRKAAALLKVSYKALLNKIKDYKIEEQYRELHRKDDGSDDYDVGV